MFDALKKIIAAVALVLAAYVGFRWGGYVFPPVERALGIRTGSPVSRDSTSQVLEEPTAELADSTLARFMRFRRGKGGRRLALSGTELSSVARFSMAGLLPQGVSDPTVNLEQGRIRLAARGAVSAFPALARLQGIMGVFPDTVPLDVEGSLVPAAPGYMALLVDKVEVAHVPLPGSMVADFLKGLRRNAPPDMPADALPVPIPDGVSSVYVQSDSLVLMARQR